MLINDTCIGQTVSLSRASQNVNQCVTVNKLMLIYTRLVIAYRPITQGYRFIDITERHQILA
jgi:hypothetical protein